MGRGFESLTAHVENIVARKIQSMNGTPMDVGGDDCLKVGNASVAQPGRAPAL